MVGRDKKRPRYFVPAMYAAVLGAGWAGHALGGEVLAAVFAVVVMSFFAVPGADV